MSKNDDETPLIGHAQPRSLADRLRSVWEERLRPQHNWRYYLNPRHSMVLFLTVALIFVGTGNRVMYKRMLNGMPNYPYFLSQLTTVIYLPIFWPIVWYLMFLTPAITADQRAFPWWKFLVMGTFDALSGTLMTIGSVHVGGPVTLLLLQTCIPLTMLFTVLAASPLLLWAVQGALNVRYRLPHYLGALVILLGIILSVAPRFCTQSNKNSWFCHDVLHHAEGAQNSNTETTAMGGIVFFVSVIPLALSGVYKEIAFKGETNLNVYYVNSWVATWQFLVGLLLAPITAIPGVGDVSFDDIPPSLWDGMKCLVGVNTHHTKTDKYDVDDCGGAWIWVCAYLLFNVTYNVIILMMIKYGSAALLYIASAVILPLSFICFTFEFVMGHGNTSEFNIYDPFALVLIIIGLFIYRATSENAGSGSEAEVEEEEEVIVPVLGSTGRTAGVDLAGQEEILQLQADSKERRESFK